MAVRFEVKFATAVALAALSLVLDTAASASASAVNMTTGEKKIL